METAKTEEKLIEDRGEMPAPQQTQGYQKPQIVTWSAEELETTGTALNACVSYGF